MLVLTRKRNEKIIIGDNIVISVVDVRGDKVRLGIEAPSDVPVNRFEIHNKIEREREQVNVIQNVDAGIRPPDQTEPGQHPS